jgi:hypothetical protein
MRSKKITDRAFDDDTFRILDIALTFLEQYFHYTPEDAELKMNVFLKDFSTRFDEDAIHHESSYRLAAIIHYLTGLNGNPNKLGDWMVANKFNQSPPDAMDYFRRHYFEKYRQG